MNEKEKMLLLNEYASSEIYENLMSKWVVDKYRTKKYPDYYAGGSLNEDMNLRIYLTTEDQDVKREISKAAGYQGIQFVKAQYSYNELLRVKDVIDDFNVNLGDNNMFNMVECLIDEDKNRIMVNLRDCSDANLENFKLKVIDHPSIEFHKVTGENKGAATVKPGRGISASSGYGGSMGYPAWKDNDRISGFMTAGHVSMSDRATYYINGSTRIGSGVSGCYNVGGYVDAALCETTSSYEVYWRTEYANQIIIQAYADPAVNSSNYFEGVTSAEENGGYHELGRLQSRSASEWIDFKGIGRVYMRDMWKSSSNIKEGDSGGICYHFDGKILGVVCAYLYDGGSLFCKAQNINEEFDVDL